MCGNLRYKQGTWSSYYAPRPWCRVKHAFVWVSGGCEDDFVCIREANRDTPSQGAIMMKDDFVRIREANP